MSKAKGSVENLAIIPARGGSKGIPNKNILPIAGKPLIAWTIEQALSSKSVSRVIVSTDSEEIAAISRKYGAEVPFMRPAELANDVAATEPSLLHALEWLKNHESYEPDNVVLLQATSPVRGPSTIDDAILTFSDSKADSLLSACEFWHFLWTNPESPSAGYDFKNRPRRQDIPASHVKMKENGSIYITSREILLSSQNRLGGKIEIFLMPEDESLEIDTHLDWALIETILNTKRAHNVNQQESI